MSQSALCTRRSSESLNVSELFEETHRSIDGSSMAGCGGHFTVRDPILDSPPILEPNYCSGWIGMFTGGYDLDFDPWPGVLFGWLAQKSRGPSIYQGQLFFQKATYGLDFFLSSWSREVDHTWIGHLRQLGYLGQVSFYLSIHRGCILGPWVFEPARCIQKPGPEFTFASPDCSKTRRSGFALAIKFQSEAHRGFSFKASALFQE